MNKLLLTVAISTILLCACKPPAPSPTEAAVPVTETAAQAPAPVESAPVAGTTAPPAAAAAASLDDHTAINASIDSVLGDHTQYETVIKAYQAAVGAGDKAAVAALVSYPINVTIDGKKTAVKDAASFVKNYDSIITPAIADALKAQKYSELMVNSQGVMFGSGETWINGICKKGSTDCSDFDVKVITIQQGG